jgi:hypothetical protein
LPTNVTIGDGGTVTIQLDRKRQRSHVCLEIRILLWVRVAKPNNRRICAWLRKDPFCEPNRAGINGERFSGSAFASAADFNGKLIVK